MSYTDFIIQAGPLLGYAIVFAILFAESGLLIGFFLPGDSLLIALGLLAARGTLNIYTLIILGSIAAVAGDSLGYATGRTIGGTLMNRKDSRFFKKEYVHKAEEFYRQYGKKTLVLARFTPVVRTFAPIVAGTARMPYLEFLTYNVIGGVSWVSSIILLGYFVGSRIPNIDRYLLPIVGIIVVVSILPALSHLRSASRGK